MRVQFGKLFIIFLVLISKSQILSAHSDYTYQISVCAIFRDDARFLKEWIEFHRLVGIEHFWLFNNLSQDDYMEVLRPYIEEGTVELIDWPYESKDQRQWEHIQNTSYEEGIRRSIGKTKWLAFIDTDEFLFSVKSDQLLNVLRKFEKYGGVCANWQMYGTSGVKHIPDNELMIDKLICKAPTEFWKNQFIKTIVRPERVHKVLHAHYPVYLEGFYTVNTDKKQVNRFKSDKVLIDQLRINHYWTRDEDFLYERKIERRDKPGSNCQDFLKYLDQLNECQDFEILRFAEALRKKVFVFP
jgi:hypothetical protein